MGNQNKYCPYCGTSLDLSAKYCTQCGQAQPTIPSTTNVEHPVSYDRNFLLLYLMNVRDLEVARKAIQQAQTKEYQQNEQKIEDTLVLHLHKEPRKPYLHNYIADGESSLKLLFLGFLISVILLFATSTFTWLFNAFHLYAFMHWAGIIILLVSIVYLLFCLERIIGFFKAKKDYQEKCLEVAKQNEAEQAKLPEKQHQADLLRKQWEKREAYFKEQKDKAESLLSEYYNMNILSKPYRNLASACYIYEYMSTSQATLEETLIHEHIENGIQRLESKLDQIIDLLRTNIYEERCARQENQTFHQQMVQQNKQMMNTLQQVDAHTLESTQYVQLIENDLQTTLFFETVDYLKS